MKRTFALVLDMVFLYFWCIFLAVAEAPFRPSISTGVTFIAIVVAIAAILITFFFLHAGIKYVTPENVLEKEIRRTIYSYLNEYPGSHLREIARDLDLKPSNAEWHLRKLEQTNLVRSRKIGGKRVYYLVEGGIEARKRAIAESILRNKNARMIMQYLQQNPGKHLLEISRALHLNHHTVKWHIKKLQMAEMVEGDVSRSAYPIYYPTEIGLEAVERFSEYIKKPGRAA
jgi:predicted transcriptional regulator